MLDALLTLWFGAMVAWAVLTTARHRLRRLRDRPRRVDYRHLRALPDPPAGATVKVTARSPQPGLDDRWIWVLSSQIGRRDPVWVRGTCRHLTPVSVTGTGLTDLAGVELARLCPDCDAQLHPRADPWPPLFR